MAKRPKPIDPRYWTADTRREEGAKRYRRRLAREEERDRQTLRAEIVRDLATVGISEAEAIARGILD